MLGIIKSDACMDNQTLTRNRKKLIKVPEGTVVGTFVSPNNVFEAVLGTAVVAAAVGEKQGGATHAEEAVGDQHGAVLAGVPIKAHHFSTNHQSIVVRVRLKHVTSQVQCYDPALHPIPPRLKLKMFPLSL